MQKGAVSHYHQEGIRISSANQVAFPVWLPRTFPGKYFLLFDMVGFQQKSVSYFISWLQSLCEIKCRLHISLDSDLPYMALLPVRAAWHWRKRVSLLTIVLVQGLLRAQ